MDRLTPYQGSHPQVMADKIAALDWQDKLQQQGAPNPERELYKHEKYKYRFLSWLERHLTGGRQIGGFKNYKLLKGV